MKVIVYSPQAVEDLKEIEIRVKADWGEEVATRIIQKLYTQIKRLKQFPFSGVNLGGMIDVPTKFRYIFVEKNYVFYYIESENVRIVRILNERRDYLYQLFGDKIKSSEEDNQQK